MSNKLIERIFQAAAALLIGTAAYFWLEGDYENVFVLVAIGCLSYFIGFRFQVKQRLAERQESSKPETLDDPE